MDVEYDITRIQKNLRCLHSKKRPIECVYYLALGIDYVFFSVKFQIGLSLHKKRRLELVVYSCQLVCYVQACSRKNIWIVDKMLLWFLGSILVQNIDCCKNHIIWYFVLYGEFQKPRIAEKNSVFDWFKNTDVLR